MPEGQKMIRFLVPLEDAAKLEKEARKLNLSVSAFIRLLSSRGVMALNLRRRKRSIVVRG